MSKKPRQPGAKTRAKNLVKALTTKRAKPRPSDTNAPLSTREALVAEVNAFLDRNGVAPTVFGVAALNDPKFVIGLRNGADVKTVTLDKVRLYMSKYEEKKSLAVGVKRESPPVPIRMRA